MHTERLKGHSCVHCEGIVLPGKEEEIQKDDENIWDGPLNKMRFRIRKVNRLGISLADLEKKSTDGCTFAIHLRQHIEEGIHKSQKGHKQPNSEAVQLFVSVTPRTTDFPPTFRFYTLVHLGTIHGPLTSTVGINLDRCYARTGSSYISCHLTADEGHNMEEFISTTPRIALQPLSDQTKCLIREWMVRCEDAKDSHHKLCSISEHRFLPSRLVEITPGPRGMILRLVRSDSMGMCSENYSALSYCWGRDGQTQKLTAHNLSRYYQEGGIPWERLPPTLRDAAIATHLLGMRYVWIDSLCIMQGESPEDDEDRTKEISQMTKVYSHATFTIMARRGDKASDGFLHDRTLPSGTSLLPFRVNNKQHEWVTVTFRSAVEDEDSGALDTRGWALQEYVMSRRHIVFGTWFTEWGCRKERRISCDGWERLSRGSLEHDPFYTYAGWDEYGSPAGSAAYESIDKSHLTDAIMFFSTNPEYQHRKPRDYLVTKTWHQLVEAFTTRNLSYGTDRILAISGMAERFAPSISHSKRYLAGLWECEMPGALLWWSTLESPPARPTTYQGPSWSWVSVNTPIHSLWASDCLCRVLAIDYVLISPDAPYGAVETAELHIEGPAFCIQWRYTRHDDKLSHSDARNDTSQCRWRRDEEDENSIDPGVDIGLDAREDGKGWENVVLLALETSKYSTDGIVLIEVEESCNRGRYRRLGKFSLFLDSAIPHPLPKVRGWPVMSFVII